MTTFFLDRAHGADVFYLCSVAQKVLKGYGTPSVSGSSIISGSPGISASLGSRGFADDAVMCSQAAGVNKH